MKKEKDLDKEIEKLKKEIEKLKKEKEEYLAGWQRERANHLNYIKEEKERLKEFLELANEKLIFKLLSVLDSFTTRPIEGDFRKRRIGGNSGQDRGEV